MRVNWMVPLRAFLALLGWIVHQINVWGGIIISIPVLPIVWLVVMMTKGAKRVGRIIKRSMMPADHILRDVLIDADGAIYGQVDGDSSAFGIFYEHHVDVRITKKGVILKTLDAKTFLIESFDTRQDSTPLAKIFAVGFLFQ